MYSIGSLPLTIVLLVGIWLSGLTWYLIRLVQHNNRLTQGAHDQTVQSILRHCVEQLEKQMTHIDALEQQVRDLTHGSQQAVQHVRVVRFNPFADTGGDQSFILTVLDGTGSGVVLSSLHSRGMSRWYAKNVAQGKSVGHELSEEEKQAVHEALKTGKNET